MKTNAQCLYAALCFCVIVPHLIVSKPMPAPGPNSLTTFRRCDAKWEETCQKCAKRTKSSIAYPMCCTNEDDVYTWCKKYLNYGMQ